MTAPPGNAEIAELFERIADLLEIRGENVFKVNAYRRAAENIRETGRPLSEVRAEGTLRQVPGVGEAIAEKIGELLDTGRLEFCEKLKNEIPESLLELLEVPDMGPKRAGLVWKGLGVTDLAGLARAASAAIALPPGATLEGVPRPPFGPPDKP